MSRATNGTIAMTMTNHRLIEHVAGPRGRRWRFRWTGTVSAWTDRLGVCAREDAAHADVALVVAWEMLSADEAVIEAWLEHAGPRTAVLERTVVPACVAVDDGLLHMDGRRDGSRLLAVTIDTATDGLLYASSSLLADAPFTAGTFDPPTGQRLAEARSVASA